MGSCGQSLLLCLIAMCAQMAAIKLYSPQGDVLGMIDGPDEQGVSNEVPWAPVWLMLGLYAHYVIVIRHA